MELSTLIKVGKAIGVSGGSLALVIGASLLIPPLIEAINDTAEKVIEASEEKKASAPDELLAEPDPV